MWSLCCIDSTKCLKHSCESSPRWHVCTTSFLQICHLHIHVTNLLLHHVPIVFYRIQIWWWLFCCSWLDSSLTWSSTVGPCSPQGSTCCAFWEAFLLTTAIKSGYLSNCKACLSFQTSLAILLWPLSWQHGIEYHDSYSGYSVWKSQISSFRNIQTNQSDTNNHALIKVTEIIFVCCDVNWSPWSVATGFYASKLCPVIGWLTIRCKGV